MFLLATLGSFHLFHEKNVPQVTSLAYFRDKRNKPKLNTQPWAELSYETFKLISENQCLLPRTTDSCGGCYAAKAD